MYLKNNVPFWAPRKRLVALAVLAASACDRGAAGSHSDAADDALSRVAPKRGDRVVVETEAAEFFEARVLEVTVDRAKVQLSSGDSRTVALSDLYPIDAVAPAKAGQLAICRAAPSEWVACRVVAVGAELEVALPGKGTRTLAPTALLAATSVTELNIKRRFERAKDREDFERDLARAGGPRAPETWKAGPADSVLVRMDRAWFSGKVFELKKRELRVELSGASRIIELPRADVIPAPPYVPAPRRGEFALARPPSASAAWIPVRVEGTGEAETVVRDASGARRTLQAADLVPLGR